MSAGQELLRIRKVSKAFGGIKALSNCNFTVKDRSIVGLIGPNGAGKTTLFNVVNGFYRADSGRIYFGKERIDRKDSYEIARVGIGRTFQILRIFRNMTTMDNLLTAMKEQEGERFFPSLLRTRGYRDQERKNLDMCEELLRFVDLTHRRDVEAGNLSYGQQKLLEIARVLALDARLLMLDEPMAGINPTMRRKLIKVIYDLRDQGKSFLIIEHDIKTIMEICDRIVVLDFGKVIADGPPEEIKENEAVINAYLGVKR
jgi:ABC-type branched-subunit amino acid transport system ATPase component